MNNDAPKNLKNIRYLLVFFILCLVLSGLTAIPLEAELDMLTGILGPDPGSDAGQTSLTHWVYKVHHGLVTTNAQFPFLAYGTDWLAFAHLVIAVAFIGPLRDPVKNLWVIEWGMIACVLIVPFAIVMGGVRGIPLGWRLIDCSFGIFGIVPLWLCRISILKITP